jgi:hypothetical protein
MDSEDIWMEVAIKNEGESSFRSLVAVNYWQCHMLFMPEQMPIGSVTNNKLGLTPKPNGVPSQVVFIQNSKSDPKR